MPRSTKVDASGALHSLHRECSSALVFVVFGSTTPPALMLKFVARDIIPLAGSVQAGHLYCPVMDHPEANRPHISENMPSAANRMSNDRLTFEEADL
jgi:hypothetical protein